MDGGMAAAQELELRGAREYHHPQSKPQSGGNLVPEGPQYRGRTAIEIINEKVYFDSVGYAYRASVVVGSGKTRA